MATLFEFCPIHRSLEASKFLEHCTCRLALRFVAKVWLYRPEAGGIYCIRHDLSSECMSALYSNSNSVLPGNVVAVR
jgi:hypothetical protein